MASSFLYTPCMLSFSRLCSGISFQLTQLEGLLKKLAQLWAQSLYLAEWHMRSVPGSYKAGIFVPFSWQSSEVGSFRWQRCEICFYIWQSFENIPRCNWQRCEIYSCDRRRCEIRFCNRKDAGFILVAGTAVGSVPVISKAVAKADAYSTSECTHQFILNPWSSPSLACAGFLSDKLHHNVHTYIAQGPRLHVNKHFSSAFWKCGTQLSKWLSQKQVQE
jgi:hypothetical protein